MWNNMVFKENQVGFGLTEEEAEKDWYTNRCRENISNDTKGIFMRRRDLLKPWLPTKDILHISGVGAIRRTGPSLVNTATGKGVVMEYKGASIYYYVNKLFGDKLSYTDISVVLEKELSEFFANISTEFLPLQAYPIVKIVERTGTFNPNIIYKYKNGTLVGFDGDFIGVKVIGDEKYHQVELTSKADTVGMVSYLCSRMDIPLQDILGGK